MKQDIYTVIENRRLTPTTWLMKLEGDTGGRQIIDAHKKDLLLVEAENEDEVKDIDRL